jgi:hypothetical protein
MSDNPNKRGPADRRQVAGGQSYEVDYLARQIHPQVPGKSRAEVEAAIVKATKVPEFNNNRKMITNAALGILGKTPW